MKGAPQGQRAYAPRNQIGKHHPQQSAQRGNHESFRQELKENVPAPRTESFLHADLAGTLRHRNQHDVHQSDAADAERQQADEAQQNFDANA